MRDPAQALLADGAEFKQLFGRALRPFLNETGFDLITFDNDVLECRGCSPKDEIRLRYGERGLALIQRLLIWEYSELVEKVA